MRDTIKLMTSRDNINLLSKINGYMIAIVTSASFLAVIFKRLGIIEEGLYPIVVISSFSVSVISTFILSNFRVIQLNKRSFFLIFGILILFLITYLRYDNYIYLNEYLINFLFFGVVIFFMVSIPFSYEKVIRGTSMLSLLILLNPIFFLNGFITDAGTGSMQIEMGLSYSLLTVSSAGLIHMIFYRKKANILVKISYIINLVFLILLLLFTVRGVLIALFVLVFSLIFTLIKAKYKILVNILLSFSIVVSGIVLFYINDLILFMYNFLLNRGIEINAITKSVYKMDRESGLTGGRSSIYETSVQLFLEKPLIGNGISYYAYFSGGSYPHNIILQLLIETGIIVTIPFIIIIIIGIRISFSSISKFRGKEGYKIFIMFCLVSSLPRLMFSSNLWEEPFFWLFTYTVLGLGVKKSNMFQKN